MDEKSYIRIDATTHQIFELHNHKNEENVMFFAGHTIFCGPPCILLFSNMTLILNNNVFLHPYSSRRSHIHPILKSQFAVINSPLSTCHLRRSQTHLTPFSCRSHADLILNSPSLPLSPSFRSQLDSHRGLWP